MFFSCVCWVPCGQGHLRCADHSFRRGCKGEKDEITVFSGLTTDWCLDESHILIQHIFTSFFLPFCFHFFQPPVYLSHSFILAIYLDLTFLSSPTCIPQCYSDYLYMYRLCTDCIVRITCIIPLLLCVCSFTMNEM